MEPPSKKMRKLMDDDSSDSGDDAGGVPISKSPEAGFKINEDYAKRFEYNKKREEVAKLESKYGKATNLSKRGYDMGEEEDESSTDEDEDDIGELATVALDAEIMDTLNAIRNKDPRVYDNNVTFYSKFDEDEANAAPKEKKEKPMTLHDYHRKNLLSGAPTGEEDVPLTFAQEQAELKNALVKELHASDDDMEDADDFLVRKSAPAPVEKKEIKLDIEGADKDPETFLSNFLSARAWVPEGEGRELHPFDSDDDDDVERADVMEEAYNFRFEDPNKLNEALVTHARDATNKQSARREDKSSRKKIREAERQRKEEEIKQRETDKNRLRKLKTEELQTKIQQIKEVAGFRASELTDDDWVRFLDGAWDDKEWEKEMEQRFGTDYYAEGGASDDKKHPKKPEWDDDIDITDLIPDYKDDDEAQPTLEDDEDEEEGEDEAPASKKSKTQDKRDQKREARKERLRITEAVDRNLDLDITLLPGATKKNATKFRYRETSPQSFGLTSRDILMADDTQLNQFAGLKKLASFRDEEKKAKDQRKLGKKARLRQWRKDTFGDENGPAFDLGSKVPETVNEEAGDDMKVDIREGDGRKKRKRSKKN
ncbi:hypothetical protein N7466_003961 [Penicillium verhagenii]|uniref:uncharacterized protein n=1 Tax=Penicillium verhagenii TaxID=1562060 RepID=UPI0025456728|nr:uncharacterized protein N7466_003961 [Penicillium verhagenii]KAJ5934414.1 hypothetical protein N7466_003961 [Penicillium verhagenii]